MHALSSFLERLKLLQLLLFRLRYFDIMKFLTCLSFKISLFCHLIQSFSSLLEILSFSSLTNSHIYWWICRSFLFNFFWHSCFLNIYLFVIRRLAFRTAIVFFIKRNFTCTPYQFFFSFFILDHSVDSGCDVQRSCFWNITVCWFLIFEKRRDICLVNVFHDDFLCLLCHRRLLLLLSCAYFCCQSIFFACWLLRRCYDILPQQRRQRLYFHLRRRTRWISLFKVHLSFLPSAWHRYIWDKLFDI